ncbi:MAG TPA: MATE family efflux transporter, partial [Candidatus Polarisedimenticolaceae bacterium]|nr:MATE family efflux transporter [Candidatus Polarisedimenticolaceae bacterium]
MTRELRPLLALALPTVLAELGWMVMGAVDTLMVGPLGPAAIGAVSIGRHVFLTVAVVGLGLLLGLDTLVAQAFGAGDRDDCRRSLVHGIGVALAATPPLMLAALGAMAAVRHWSVDPQVLEQATSYLHGIIWGTAPLLLYFALRRYLQGMNVVRPVMLALVSANAINLFGNWVLVYGKLGAPALGVSGSAWATCLSFGYMAAFLVVAVLLHDRGEGGRLRRMRHVLEPARL